MIKRQHILGITTRARADAKWFFYCHIPIDENRMFEKAMSDFDVIPYPLRWYLYRSNFRKTFKALKKEYSQ